MKPCYECGRDQVQVIGSTTARCRYRECRGHAWISVAAWESKDRSGLVATVANIELERLRTIEAWVLEHAQHGASCMYWGTYDETDKARCTCGLAKIMEGMP